MVVYWWASDFFFAVSIFFFLFRANLRILDLFLVKWSYFYISRKSRIFFRTEINAFSIQFTGAKLCSNSSCTLYASIGFIIFKFKRWIEQIKTSPFWPKVLQVSPAADFKCCSQMHRILNLMQGNMWKKVVLIIVEKS